KGEPEPSGPTASPGSPRIQERIAWAGFALFVAIAATLTFVHFREAAPPAESVVKFPLTIPDDQQLTSFNRRIFAVSPDGTRFTYVANNQLYLRSMGEMEARPIPGTNLKVSSPVFGPDGQWVGFYSDQDGTLKKIAISGGPTLTICRAENPFGISWDGD